MKIGHMSRRDVRGGGSRKDRHIYKGVQSYNPSMSKDCKFYSCGGLFAASTVNRKVSGPYHPGGDRQWAGNICVYKYVYIYICMCRYVEKMKETLIVVCCCRYRIYNHIYKYIYIYVHRKSQGHNKYLSPLFQVVHCRFVWYSSCSTTPDDPECSPPSVRLAL